MEPEPSPKLPWWLEWIFGTSQETAGSLVAKLVLWGVPLVLAGLRLRRSYWRWATIVLDVVVGWACLYIIIYGLTMAPLMSMSWWVYLSAIISLVALVIWDWKRGAPEVASISAVKIGGDTPVYFGAPVQRSKEEPVSHWCVPIRIDEEKIKKPSPTKTYPCELYLDGYSDGKSKKGVEGIKLWVGDVGLGEVTERADLAAGSIYLVPVVWRSEAGDDRNGYITDGRFFWVPRQYEYPVFPNREKQRYHLRVKSAFFDCVSPHFYFLRVPTSSSNGHFVLEMEHK